MTEYDGVERSTATKTIRAMLDERGVEYRIERKQTRATFEPFDRFIVLDEHGGLRGTIDVYLDGACNCTWQFDDLTPEQAIAATLGPGTCKPTTYDNDYSAYRVDPGDYYEFWEPACACGNCGELIPMRKFCPNCGCRLEVDE